MENPLRIIRTYNGYSLEKVSEMTDVSRQYIDQLEKGFYDVPNFSVLRAYSKITGNELGVRELKLSYDDWKVRHREESIRRYGLQPIRNHLLQVAPVGNAGGVKLAVRQPKFISDSLQPRYRIFTKWREIYFPTQYSFCLALCIKPQDVSRYEGGKSRGMPHSIQAALGKLTEGFAVEYR